MQNRAEICAFGSQFFGQPALAFIMLSDRRDRFHMLVAVHFAQTSPVLCAADLPRAHDEFRASGCDGSAPLPHPKEGCRASAARARLGPDETRKRQTSMP